MTAQEIEARVDEIRPMAGDDEAAHSTEFKLWVEVMGAIHDGTVDDALACVGTASSVGLDFFRW